MSSSAAQAALARPGMVLMTTMFWALSMLVMLSRKMVRSFSAKFSRVRLPDTAYLYTPWPTGSFMRCICLMSREMVAWVLVIPPLLETDEQLLLGLDILLADDLRIML